MKKEEFRGMRRIERVWPMRVPLETQEKDL